MASLDYLRLASFDFSYSSVIAKFMNDWPGKMKPGRWLQYKGWKTESLFVGAGEQKGKRHLIISCSGPASNDLAIFVKDWKGLYCTRLDVQRTIQKSKYSSLRRIRKATGKKNTTLIQSKDNDTLYIGSRTSDCFTRLYEKPLDEMYLRLEFELKGKRARSAWLAMAHGKTPATIFVHYLNKSKLPNTVKTWYTEPSDKDETAFDEAEALHSAKKKLRWLRSLDACMEKAMGNHQIGEEVKELARGWAKYADDLDKT